jgi:hypothetical protein
VLVEDFLHGQGDDDFVSVGTFNVARGFLRRWWVALAHAAGVNPLIWVILAAGKRVNKSFRYSNELIPCRRQLPSKV